MIIGPLLVMLALASAPGEALTPRAIADVAFTPRTGTPLPARAHFRDEHGQPGELGGYFTERPGIVVLGYYGCSDLCGLVLQGLAEGLAAAELHAGRDVDVVVVSIAAEDTPATAMARKRSLARSARGAADVMRWHFLTGDRPAIDALDQALDFRATYDAEANQYAHAAGITLVGRGGVIRGMLPGIIFPPPALRATALSSDGGVAPAGIAPAASITAAQRWLLCFHYDPQTGRYTFAAMNAVRLAALAALAALLGYVARAGWRETRRRRRDAS